MAEKKDKDPVIRVVETQTGEQVEIRVNSVGVFYAKFQEKDYQSDTLANLTERLEKLGKKAAIRVAIPVTRIVNQRYGRGEVYESGTLNGLHATTGKVLYKGDVSGSEQLDGWKIRSAFSGDATIFTPLTPAQIEEHKALVKAVEAAKEKLSAFNAKYSIDVEKTVKEAIEKLVGREVADAR